ncbi:MAG: hypothetical protein SVP52_06010 [Chloroflexota bacterium]|nr:hypothetical protein [Chloroflexota bacterium]
MESNKNILKRIKIMRWVARVWSTLTFLFGLILFVSLIIDASNEPPTSIYWWLFSLWFASVLGLMLGWRWERAGGIIALTSLISRELTFFFERTDSG